MIKIIILHGWTYSTDKWNSFVELLKKSGFEVEILRIPGLTIESDEVWDLKKYSDWLQKELSEEKAKVILLGHSNGGRIASYFTSMYPEKISKLILIDTAGIYHKNLYIQIKRFIFGNVAKMGKKITNSESLKKFLYGLAGEHDYQRATPNMKNSMVNLTNTDLTDDFQRIKVNTLIIWGDQDKMTPVSDGLLIHKLIKNSVIKIINGARHSPFYTHPKEVVEIIKNDI